MIGRISEPTLSALFAVAGERWGDTPAFATRRQDGSFRAVTYAQWLERSLALATALIDLDIEPRDHVAILSNNRFEWILSDAAIQFCGAADVPRASDITEQEIVYILNHADVKVAFVETMSVLAKIESVREQLPSLRHLILMENDGGEKSRSPLFSKRILSLRNLEIQGEAMRLAGDRRVEARIAAVQPEDLFTIIYTSGTTGVPKGVQLTHASIASQIRNLPLELSSSDRALSILPIWHSYERIFKVISISCGLCTYYTSLRYLAEDLQSVKPTIMVSAPRLWEGLYKKILSRVESQPPLARFVFKMACFSAHSVRRAGAFFRGQQIDLTKRHIFSSCILAIRHSVAWMVMILPFLLFDRVVLNKLRAVVGGQFRGTISGGGALPPHVDEFFNDIGIPVLEGYGLTESCPVLAVRTWSRLVIGTVGPVFPETEIRIVDPVSSAILCPDGSRSDLGRGIRGEIHARGPQIMKGYYKDPEGTSKVLKEGWLATGDLGLMTFNDCLKIVGRCKETIVLLGGENVEPLPIESRLLESPLIDQCIVVGQDKKQLGLLVVPSLSSFASLGLKAPDLAALKYRPEARAMIREEIKRLVSLSAGFKPFERIACFEFLEFPFEVGEELTMTFKLKRHVISEKYDKVIYQMFGE